MKVFADSFLISNWLFIKSCCFLWSKHITDLVFIPNLTNVIIKAVHQGHSESIAEVNLNDFKDMMFKLKLYAKVDLLQENKPQNFSINLGFNHDICWFRCSIHPSLHSSTLAIRLIRPMFFQWNQSLEFKGLNIIFGPTGSGKTTYLYGIMSTFPGHIISLEDPIEYELPNVCQTDVSSIGYDEYIKSAMRMNPELIFIGEIRNSESAHAAILAALTGHGVIATMHAGSVNDIFLRMKQMGCLNFEDIIAKCIQIKNYQVIEIKDFSIK